MQDTFTTIHPDLEPVKKRYKTGDDSVHYAIINSYSELVKSLVEKDIKLMMIVFVTQLVI